MTSSSSVLVTVRHRRRPVHSIGIVQQSAWDIPMDSVPLAAGYLKAVVIADETLRDRTDVTIHNFRGGETLTAMATSLFRSNAPDMLAFSVVGWNYRNFVCLAETYKQLRPDGLVAFGGTHVSHQAKRVFRDSDAVDIVVNGEGERTFRELVAAAVEGPDPHFSAIRGLSYRELGGEVATTPERERIDDLDEIPSPFLTGAIPLTDSAGHFPYEFALIETNRGCPYKCAFCYWGGATGERVRSFSRDRLAAELDLFGFHRVPTVFLCDANFGMRPADEVFVHDLIDVRKRYGFPQALEANWAKNKSRRFYRIVRALKEHDLKSSFTLALQTLTDVALEEMQRSNMRVNEWRDLVDWLADEGMECYAELIWGAPGDTPETFLHGYDELAERVPRIAVYPLLILPNTGYAEHRDDHGFVTVRGQGDDYEYVIANRSATISEHLEMQRFMFLARLLGENQYFKRLWMPALRLAGLRQSETILSLLAWLDASEGPSARRFVRSFPTIAESPSVASGHRMLYSDPGIDAEIERWWLDAVVSRFPVPWRAFGAELYQFERWNRPVYQPAGAPAPPNFSEIAGEYLSEPIDFHYPIDLILAQLQRGEVDDAPLASRQCYRIRSKVGFYLHLDNHETGSHYFGRVEHAGSVSDFQVPET